MVLLEKDTTKIFSGQPSLLKDYINTCVHQRELLLEFFGNHRICISTVLYQLCRIHGIDVLKSDITLFISGDEINEPLISGLNKLSRILTTEYISLKTQQQ